MKRLFSLIYLIQIFASYAQNSSTISTPESFSEAVVISLIENDFESFQFFFINEEDFDYLINMAPYETEKSKENVRNSKEARMKIIEDMVGEKFRVESSDFNNYQFHSCSYKIKVDGKVGLEYISNMNINLSNGSESKLFIFEKVCKTNRGWVSVGTFSTYNYNISDLKNFDQIDFEYIQLQKACEICIINERLSNIKYDMVNTKFHRKSQSKYDSLRTVKIQLLEQYDSSLEEFKVLGKYKSVFFAKDSAKAICMRSIILGTELELVRRRQIITTLASEILDMNSGFTLSSKKYLLNRIPKKNDNGELIVHDRMDVKKIIIINDFEEWRANEIKYFEEWMKKIDDLLFELHGKSYANFEEIEKIILDHNMHSILDE